LVYSKNSKYKQNHNNKKISTKDKLILGNAFKFY